MNQLASNALSSARSAYLRSARHQPIRWMEWGPEAFSEAQQEDKPILLDIGAVWCHWCHVMDRESYEDPETARIINEHFIAVKVDRDERPDVDARYQAAVAAISGQGGWPLTALLTPDGLPFFGGTYFPPVDGHGRPSLRRVLMTMAEAFEKRRHEVLESAASVMEAIEQNETFDGSRKNPGPGLVEKIVDSALQQFDPRHGGFGSQPKFPNASALDLLLDEAGRGDAPRARAARTAAITTLQKMAQGGIYDHLAGGFHRYSVDERWVVPHFEKMSYDNSELLKNFVHAYRASGEAECARIVRETMAWIDAEMSDREHGGFYASQDADVTLDDDGDYFTWTRAEAEAVLTPPEMAVASEFFDIGELGDMRHNPLKNTLHIEQPLGVVARRAGVELDRAADLVASAKAKLHAARKLRPTPYIDKTIYTGWNAMMISAYLEAGRALGQPSATAFALKSLHRLLSAIEPGGFLRHVIAYGESSHVGPTIPGVLEDCVLTGHAALDAWEATGAFHYFEAALTLANHAIARFHDAERGGFFDTEIDVRPDGNEKLGALSARRKPLQDSPTPAGNPVAAALLLRLHALTGRADLREKAQATLECFAGVVEHFGLYAASFGLALRRLLLPPVQVVVVGTDALADELERTALRGYAVEKSVLRLPSTAVQLPPLLAETIPILPQPNSSFAVVCANFTCGLPVASVNELRAGMSTDAPPAAG